MRYPILIILAFSTMVPCRADHAQDMQRSMDVFKSTVRPFFVEQCLECHGGKKVKSAFNLNTREGLLAGGDQGMAVTAGSPEESPLLAYVSHREEPYMPPKKPKASKELRAALEQWVALGAAYDNSLGGTVEVEGPLQVAEEDKAFWSFAPLIHPTAPKVKNPEWQRHPIDRFVATRHEQAGLQPAPLLDKQALIRRVTYDLTGLPPTPEEIDAFLADTRSDAYERLIKNLLSRRQYGERWARHWLDVARFAESHGFEHDYDRKHAYHYRDFVIKALNQDMSWTRMVEWQLAGDELAPEQPLAMMATGFLGAGVYPTQITVAEAERIRYDAIDDMVSTTCSAMLGLTVGCARCHDHKYDPIPLVDYYRLASAFTTTVRSDVDVADPVSPKAHWVFDEKKRALAAARKQYEEEQLPARMHAWFAKHEASGATTPATRWKVLDLDTVRSAGGATMSKQPDRSVVVTGKNPAHDTYTIETSTGAKEIRALRIEALTHKSMVRNGPGRAGNGNFGLSNIALAWRPGGSNADYQPVKLTHPRATFEQNKGNLSIAATIDTNGTSGWAVDPQFGKDHAAVYALADELQAESEVEIKVVLTFTTNGQHNFGRFRVSVSGETAAALPLQEEVDTTQLTVTEIKQFMAAGNEAAALARYRTLDAEWQKLNQAVVDHENNQPGRKTYKVMICGEGYKPMRHHVADGSIKDFYPETYVLHRGDVSQKMEVASLSYLQVLMRHPNADYNWMVPRLAGSKGSYRRASLASWMTDVEHGAGHLLARVLVNRLWQHHFGEGLVGTPNNFGFNGARPSHPELLDWLAQELIRNGWRLKPMHELIMSSKTYRMGSMQHAGNQAKDPDNLQLWQRLPRRLEAEAIRDAMLAVSGRLDPTSFGPGTLSESHTRRSIYFMVKRSKLIPFLQVFDFPDTLNSLGSRAVTTTSLQALVFLNHPEVHKMAGAFADRIRTSGGEPVETAYRMAFGRPPGPVELARGKEYIASTSLTDFCHAVMSMNEFIYVP